MKYWRAINRRNIVKRIINKVKRSFLKTRKWKQIEIKGDKGKQ
jgi:hypothetical protein